MKKCNFLFLLAAGVVACGTPAAPAESSQASEGAEGPAEGAESEPGVESEPGAESGPGAGGRRMFIECAPESRGPVPCTRDLRPVCAQLTDNQAKTYPNPCTACSDENVAGYFTGACDTGENQ